MVDEWTKKAMRREAFRARPRHHGYTAAVGNFELWLSSCSSFGIGNSKASYDFPFEICMLSTPHSFGVTIACPDGVFCRLVGLSLVPNNADLSEADEHQGFLRLSAGLLSHLLTQIGRNPGSLRQSILDLVWRYGDNIRIHPGRIAAVHFPTDTKDEALATLPTSDRP